LTGHCISIKYITDEYLTDHNNYDWNCPDASDNIGLLGITQLSEHNIKIIDDSVLQKKKKNIEGDEYVKPITFNNFCNISKEYGCILANVNDPLNFTINRPCINLTQIGDGIIDCYGGLDERNLLTCGNNTDEQRGFDFHCSDQQCIPYHNLCEERCSNKADSLLCDQLPSFQHPSCLDLEAPHKILCMYVDDKLCDIGTKYYCDISRIGK
jgi:hypothetical protein